MLAPTYRSWMSSNSFQTASPSPCRSNSVGHFVVSQTQSSWFTIRQAWASVPPSTPRRASWRAYSMSEWLSSLRFPSTCSMKLLTVRPVVHRRSSSSSAYVGIAARVASET